MKSVEDRLVSCLIKLVDNYISDDVLLIEFLPKDSKLANHCFDALYILSDGLVGGFGELL